MGYNEDIPEREATKAVWKRNKVTDYILVIDIDLSYTPDLIGFYDWFNRLSLPLINVSDELHLGNGVK